MRQKKLQKAINIGKGEVVLEIPEKIDGQLKENVFSALLKNKKSSITPDFDVNIKENTYILTAPDSSEMFIENWPELIYEIEWRVVDLLVNQNKQYLQLHSAALNYNEKGFLFIGEGGSGKTSLSILLMKNDFRLFSDEIGMLDTESFQISPFPRNLIIKSYLKPYLNIENKSPFSIDDENGKISAYFVAPEKYGKVEESDTTSVSKIFFLSKI